MGCLRRAKRKETAADKLKAELKLLEWHKLANDAAIKVRVRCCVGFAASTGELT